MSFNLSEVIHIISTIDDLLSMSEHPYTITTATGYDIEESDDEEVEDEEVEFIKFTFPLKNGISSIKMYDSVGSITYKNQNGEVLKDLDFDDMNIGQLNGSFKKAFKQVREFDRQQVGAVKSANTSIDRASFGLAEVN
jgi:hypothetical protein